MKPHFQESGLTLIEVLLASALLVLAVFALGGGFNYANSVSAFAQSKIMAANDAEKVMEEARRVADAVGLSGTNGVTDSSYWTTWIAGQTFSSLPNRSISVTFPEGTSGNPIQTLVTVSWTEKGATRSYKLYTLVTPRS